MALNARSIASCNFASLSPPAVISTNVPREGRARRTLFEADFISREDASNAIGHMPAGKRCATDIVDAVVDSEPRARSFADELLSPIRIANFAAITFPVIQNFDLFNRSLRRKRDGIIDHEMFANNVIDNEEALQLPASRRPPNFLAAKQLLLPACSFDRLNLRGREFHVCRGEAIAIGEAQFLRGGNRQILHRVARQRHRDAHRGGQNPARELVHIGEDSNAILEKETDRAKQVIRAGRIRRIVERELVVDLQDNLRRGEKSKAKSVKLSLTLTGGQVVVGSGESARL
jgi:hypothetical protein